MEELVQILKEKQLTIGSCESLTAGLFTSKIAEVSGASAVLKGGFVTYQTSVKHDVIHVEQDLIDTYGVVSEEVANAMASHAKKLLHCDICVSFTGNAGPDAMEGKPVGRVYSTIAMNDLLYSFCLDLKGTRNEIRMAAVMQMCEEIKKVIR